MEAPSPPPPPDAPSKLAGRWSVVMAAVLWSSSGLFAKQSLFDDWPVEVRGSLLAFWRAVFAVLVLLPAIRRPRWSGYLVPLTASFTLMNVTYLTAMVQTTAGNAIWLQSVYPWWVFLFSVFLFGQPVVRRDLIPLAFGMLGVGLILYFELSRGHASTGVACGAASGFFYAGVVVLMWRLCSDDPAWLVALNHLVTAVILFPWIIHLGYWPSLPQLAVLACFGAFQMAIPYLLLIRGMRAIGSQEASVIGLIEPVLVPLWVWWAGLESPAWWTRAGAALILLGLLLRYAVFDLCFTSARAGSSPSRSR